MTAIFCYIFNKFKNSILIRISLKFFDTACTCKYIHIRQYTRNVASLSIDRRGFKYTFKLQFLINLLFFLARSSLFIYNSYNLRNGNIIVVVYFFFFFLFLEVTPTSFHSHSEMELSILRSKGHLILRMLQQKIGHDLLVQVHCAMYMYMYNMYLLYMLHNLNLL